MIPRRILLTDCRRFVHLTPLVERQNKLRVVATIDNHEFHKVIKFVRPEKLYPWDPRISCDLKRQEPIDPTWLKFQYRPFADIINQLPEEQRKVFTVEFGPRSEGTKVILQDALAKTRRHKYDNSSLDFKVTWSTWKIRNIQDTFREIPEMRRVRYLRVTVKELIDKRKKWLNQMRHQDYKRFEWIIEMVGVIYKLRPPYTRIERKASINVLVNLFCNELRDKKMAEYKEQLESEKVPFLKLKLETLQEIRADEESVGLSSSVDDDIHETRRLLLKLEKDHMTITPSNITNEEANTSATAISSK